MLNSDTLLIVQVVFTALVTLLLVSVALTRDALKEQRLWALGNAVSCLGLAVGAATSFPVWVHGAVSYGLMGLGLTLVLRGLRLFCGARDLSPQFVVGLSLIAGLLPLYFGLVQPSLQGRLVVTGLYFGLLNTACADTVLRALKGEARKVMWPTLLGFGFLALALFVRAIYLLLRATNSLTLSQVDTVMNLTMLAIPVAQVSIGFGLVIMVAHRYAHKLNRLTMLDSLTGAYNRSVLERMGLRMVTRARQSGRSIAVAMVDTDHFKFINDTYGHPVGDQVLCHLVAKLSEQLRTSDLVVRYGGEEFVLMMDGLTLTRATTVAERLRSVIEQSELQIDGKTLQYRVSIGVSCSDHTGYDLPSLISAADGQLYSAKQQGRNRVSAEPLAPKKKVLSQ